MSDTKPLSEYSELLHNEVITKECVAFPGTLSFGPVSDWIVGNCYQPYANPPTILGPKDRTKIIAASGSSPEATLKPSEATAKRWFKPTSGPGGFALADALMALEDPALEVERAKLYDSKRRETLGNLIEEAAEAIKEAASREEPATEAALFSQEAINRSCEVLKRKLKKIGIRVPDEMMKEMILDRIAEDTAEAVAQAVAKAVEDFAVNQCKKNKEMDSSDKSIHVTFDKFEGPDILDDGRGDVRVTLNTMRGIERVHLFPKQAQSLYAALGVWFRKSAQASPEASA